ncbi:MAG: response regulator [Desulfobacteraceae bacterium]|nr:response regulator [Desulfobacteraceae bacterium]
MLVVDDKEENRLVMRDLLEIPGIEVEMAENGYECIDKAVKTMPDLIFMDLVMPKMNGFEAAEKIKKMKQLENIPVIAVSASFMNISNIKEKGFDAFLSKPLDTDELFAVLKKYLPVECGMGI